ncbi:hypothetical protein MRX96_022530 [Rhipicephalus microplus]
MDENLSRGYIQLGRQRVVLQQPGGPLGCRARAFITAVDYFQDKYPRTTIVFDMNLVYILTAFLAVVVNNLLVETLPLQVRITFGYLLSFATLLFVALVEVHWESFEHDVGYTVNLVAIAIVALGCTVQQSSFYGYTSMLPSRYTQAVMTGESAAGVLVSANRILTKALLRDERLNTLLFFLVSVTVVMLCFVIHLVLHRTRFVRFYLDLCAAAAEEGKCDGDDALHSRILLEPTEDVGLQRNCESTCVVRVSEPLFGLIAVADVGT